MPPYNNRGKASMASVSRELQQSRHLDNFAGHRMAETSVVVDSCAENKICSSKKSHITDSSMSLHSCTCGPECGPDKCNGRKSTSLVAWDDTRTKIFLLLIGAFAVWMLIYIPISVMSQKGSHGDGDG